MARRRQPSEASLVDGCLRMLRAWGCFAWRNNTGAARYGRPGERERYVHFGLKGGADILGWTEDGRGVAVECKRLGNRATEHQIEFVSELASRGGFACVVYSVDELILLWERYQKEGKLDASFKEQGRIPGRNVFR